MAKGKLLSLDHMAVVCVVIAGVVEATQQALSNAPNVTTVLPTFVVSPNLNYVPLGLLTVAGFMWVVKQFQKVPAESAPVVEQIPPDPVAPQIEEVVNQPFKNQEVLLDGHAYFACIFENCSFVYNFGPTGGFASHCNFTGSRGIKSSDPRLAHLLHFMESLGLLNPFIKPLYTPKSVSMISEGSIEDEADKAIDMIMGDKGHPYWQGDHPQHKEAVEYVQKLHQIAKRWEKKKP
jgi:hypothetical protein